MGTYNLTSGDLLLGRDAGQHLSRAIREAQQQILVCSPYIGERPIDQLIEKAQEGVHVSVVTSDSNRNTRAFYRVVVQQRNTRERQKKISGMNTSYESCLRTTDPEVVEGLINEFNWLVGDDGPTKVAAGNRVTYYEKRN